MPTTKGAPSRGSDTFRLRSVPGGGTGHTAHAPYDIAIHMYMMSACVMIYEVM